MTTHTPGPWFASPVQTADDGWQFVTVGPFEITDADEHHVEETICEVSGIDHPCGPNARLIAAAPDLLAACKEFVRKCDIGSARSVRSYAQMTAAIAKAEGR